MSARSGCGGTSWRRRAYGSGSTPAADRPLRPSVWPGSSSAPCSWGFSRPASPGRSCRRPSREGECGSRVAPWRGGTGNGGRGRTWSGDPGRRPVRNRRISAADSPDASGAGMFDRDVTGAG
ncbi:hypothetical protein CA984_02475 [Streptosporangium minutum]|uniref:Uncharacterized protein n=1 Tax=Streptosporangium minutum TaxID=569862 RepID=A0A243RX38_9ACTN|nr:hypothetical protein CA984_02475 [Streptosporangium minutum]